jgi:3'-5' exonuclease
VIKSVKERVWAFDLEWVPDPLAGRLLYDVPAGASSPREVMDVMWREGGASEEDPTPFLKTVLCRIVSIAAVERRAKREHDEPVLTLLSLPKDPANADEARETHLVGTFLEAIGKHRPQLVGFNSQDSDLKILIQRGVVLGVQAGGFSQRPDKPWEDANVDLKKLVGGFGKAVPSLNELAVQCGIPGKMGVDGNDVAAMWLEGRLAEIVAYNEFDALTTYLVWLRMAHFSGHFSEGAYTREQELVRALIERELAGGAKPHLARYLEEWDRLRKAIGER